MYRVLSTENNADAAQANYRNIIHFDQKNCPSKVLNAFEAGQITIDVADKNGDIMYKEASYMDLDKKCWNTRRGLYFQVRRDALHASDKQQDVMNGKRTRDIYYAVVDGVSAPELAALV